MAGELNGNNHADLRMCFDYISQVRELDAKTRLHNVNLIIIELGAISWILFSELISDLIIQSILIAILSLFLIASVYTNFAIGKTDYYCQILQAMILNGKISTCEEFIESFDKTILKTRNFLNVSMKSAIDLLNNEQSK